MATNWKDYQEEAAEFFRSLGASATTDGTITGVRTTHNIDVLVTLNVSGFEVKWLIECKHWKSPVNKFHVFGLREIASDTGADRGIILCEAGFQSGAVEAANLTNIQVTSLSALSESSKEAIYAAKMRDLYDRINVCREKYWDIPKNIRIEKGLRFDTGGDHIMYSGARIVEVVNELLARGFRGIYPVAADDLYVISNPTFPKRFDDCERLVCALEPLVIELEAKLDKV